MVVVIVAALRWGVVTLNVTCVCLFLISVQGLSCWELGFLVNDWLTFLYHSRIEQYGVLYRNHRLVTPWLFNQCQILVLFRVFMAVWFRWVNEHWIQEKIRIYKLVFVVFNHSLKPQVDGIWKVERRWVNIKIFWREVKFILLEAELVVVVEAWLVLLLVNFNGWRLRIVIVESLHVLLHLMKLVVRTRGKINYNYVSFWFIHIY